MRHVPIYTDDADFDAAWKRIEALTTRLKETMRSEKVGDVLGALQCILVEVVVANTTSPRSANLVAAEIADFVRERVAEETRRRMN